MANSPWVAVVYHGGKGMCISLQANWPSRYLDPRPQGFVCWHFIWTIARTKNKNGSMSRLDFLRDRPSGLKPNAIG